MKYACVLGAGGFLGHHLVKRLKADGWWVRGVDRKYPEFEDSSADEFKINDLRYDDAVRRALNCFDSRYPPFDVVFQLAAEVGGLGYIMDKANDAAILRSSMAINLNVARIAPLAGVKRLFFASSACVYPDASLRPGRFRGDVTFKCSEGHAYPFDPRREGGNEYATEKLFAERLYLAVARCEGLPVRIARLHNCYGALGTWRGGREKAPAAICRKVAEAADGDDIEVWGDGTAVRTFMHVDDAIEGILRITESDVEEPINLGSDEEVTISELVQAVAKVANKQVAIKHVPGPVGVRTRSSDNSFIKARLGWTPSISLEEGLRRTYPWIAHQVREKK